MQVRSFRGSSLLERNWVAPATLLFITVGIFWKLTLTREFTWLNSPDAVNQVLPWFQFQAEEWHHGRFPLWDPHHWGGQSLVGQAQPGVVYPLNWLLFLAPLKHGHLQRWILNAYFVFIHYMAAIFFYLLCRDLKITRISAIVAGSAFGLGAFLGNLGWPQMLNGAVWTPLVFLFFFRVLRCERPLASSVTSGAILGFSFLGGHHQIPMFVTVCLAGLWIYYLISRPRDFKRGLVLMACFGGMAVLAGAAQIFPSYEYWHRALRWVGTPEAVLWNDRVPYAAHVPYSLNPVAVLGILFPPILTSGDAFTGVVMLVLAIVGVVKHWRDETVRLLTGVAFGALIFAFGGYSVFHGLAYGFIPDLDKARVPAMALLLFHAGVFALAAFGMDTIRTRAAAEGALLTRLAVVLAVASGLVYSLLLITAFLSREKVFELHASALTALVMILVAAILTASKRASLSEGATVRLLALCMFLEIGSVTGSTYADRTQGWPLLQQLSDNYDIAQFLKRQAGLARFSVNTNEIPYDFGDWHGLDQLQGYAGVTANVYRVWGERNTQRLLGVTYYIARSASAQDQALVFEAKSGLKVYQNPDTFPRVWSVHGVQQVSRSADPREALGQPLDVLRKRAFMVDPPPALESCDGAMDHVQIARMTGNYIEIQASIGCRGMLIVANTFDPGWKAQVDEKPATVYETYGFLQGIAVSGGNHTIRMNYRPGSFMWGALCSILSLAVVLATALAPRMARHRGRAGLS